MPLSSGSGGGVPNMTLKAWAYVARDGSLLRGQGVASVAKQGTGGYRINFAVAMSRVDYVGRVVMVSGDYEMTGGYSASTVSYASVSTVGLGSSRDGAFYVEFYE